MVKSELFGSDAEDDLYFMQKALVLAQKAGSIGEVPVGAVVVKDGIVIGRGWNLRETKQNPILHAEIVAIQSAAKKVGAWRLNDTTLYVTLEPCLMCAGAIYQSRIGKVVFAAFDPKAGACGSLFSIHDDVRLNHRFSVSSGPMSNESSNLLKDFFRLKRKGI